MIYIIVFIISSVLIYMSSKIKRHKVISSVIGIMAVLLLSMIAGLRDHSVGTDTEFYLIPYYELASSYSYIDFISEYIENAEFAFLTLEYISANIIGSPIFIMFVMSFLTNLFVYLGIKNLEGNNNYAFAWLIYCFVHYNVTLNLIRQYVAVAIIFYLFSNEKNITVGKVAILTAFALLFHTSALAAIPFFLIYKLLKARKQNLLTFNLLSFEKKKYKYLLLMIIGVTIVGSLIDMAFYIGLSSGYVAQKYSVYIGNNNDIAWGNILFKSFSVVVFLLYYFRKGKKSRSESLFWLCISLCYIILLSSNSLLITRILPYFTIFEIVSVSYGVTVFAKKSYDLFIIKFLFILLYFVFWIYQFVLLGLNATIPYKFIDL